jgi:hypothetical protein
LVVTVVFRWEGLDHIPLYEGNIFVDNDDHWWGSRCGNTDRLERRIDELSDGVPTCFECLGGVWQYADKYGREPDDGARRLAPRLELRHGREEEAGAASAAQDEASTADQEHAQCSVACRHRAY